MIMAGGGSLPSHFSFLSEKSGDQRERKRGRWGWRFDRGEESAGWENGKPAGWGRAGRLPTSGRASPQREVMVVSVNGAQPGSAGHSRCRAWAQRELELGQGKAGAGGSGGWAGSGEGGGHSARGKLSLLVEE